MGSGPTLLCSRGGEDGDERHIYISIFVSTAISVYTILNDTILLIRSYEGRRYKRETGSVVDVNSSSRLTRGTGRIIRQTNRQTGATFHDLIIVKARKHSKRGLSPSSVLDIIITRP